ncbi:MAG TPA: ATP-binding protein, partial [Anaerolineae bacterium]|nr:ATP-binding protein [Anaerolineae bacterium]
TQEQRWQSSPDNSDFVVQYRNNPQTIELSKFRGADLLHNNVFLTDRRGGLVAVQGERPANFFYGDEAWWQTAWDNGQGDVYVGQLTIDPNTKLASIFIAVGVLNPQTNQTIGVLASTYQLRAVQRDISVASNQIPGDLVLLSSDGLVIAGSDEVTIGQSIGPNSLTPTSDQAQPLTEPGWLLGPDSQGEPVVLAHAPLNTSSGVNLDPLRALGWQVVVSDTQDNALAGVTRSTKVATLVGLLAMALGVLAATAATRVITRPIEALTTAAAAISGGDLEQQAKPVGPVELVTLAEAFNTLTARLRLLINSLQDQVAQRTAQLEARVEQLATLNRITQTVASVRDQEAALEIVAREMVQLFKGRNSGIALLNPAQTQLTVVAEYSRDPAEAPVVGTVIPLAGNPSSSYVVRTGRSMVVPQAQTSPSTQPIHELLRLRQIQCLLIAPLLARGEVIGTIAVATDEVDREFTPAEVTLAETVAGQIAGAIENARLFSEMEKAKEVAEAANEAKSTFLANVSHELRTPLTAVLGFAKIIEKRLAEVILPRIQADLESANDAKTQRAVKQVRENVGIIVAEGQRLTNLINDVLDLAKIEAGKVEWQMQSLAMTEIVERAIAATSALFEQKPLKLVKEVADDLPQVVGDRDRLIQVVINLISNAVKFTDQGSVTCRVQPADGEIVISIIDTGIGIAEADQPKVFEKFIQVGNTLIDKPQGTGLGLPICRQIIEQHGGRIWLESKLGQGSTFSFALPIDPQERLLAAEPQPASASP